MTNSFTIHLILYPFISPGSSLTQINQVELTDRDTYRSHPCLRDCKKGESLTCHYEFVVEEYETMSKACYNCPRNLTDCNRPHCISADGMRRSIIVVNRMFPGPTIEVRIIACF